MSKRVFIFVLAVLVQFSGVAHALSLTVDDPADSIDTSPGDGKCEATGHIFPVCTLRAAIMEANAYPGTDTITIPSSGTYSITRSGTDDTANSGDLDINSNMTITATTFGVTITKDAAVSDRIFHVTGNYQFSLQRVTVSGGSASNGGNIYNNGGTINLRNVRIKSGTATSYGGGIYNWSGTVSVDSGYWVEFTSNQANYGGGLYNWSSGNFSVPASSTATFDSNSATNAGGAIYNFGILQISHGTFTDNTAGTSSGAINSYGASATLTISDSVFTGNISSGNGGAITNDGTMTIINSEFTGNSSTTLGGAICHHGGSLTFNYNTLDSNSSGNAGALHVAGTGTNSVGSSLIVDNTASNSGGGIFVNSSSSVKIKNSTLSANTAAVSGGGLFNAGTSELSSSTIYGNSGSDGGGIYNAGTSILRNSIIAENTATSSGSDCKGTITSSDYNLIGDVYNCSITLAANDQYGDSSGSGILDPELDILANNGGSTDTHALLSTSPAIDAGNPAGCTDGTTTLWYDQRYVGYNRTVDGDLDGTARCDIGAYEYVP